MNKKKIIKRVLILIGVSVLAISAVFYIGIKSRLDKFSEEVSSIEINNVDLSSVDDGEYEGEYYVNPNIGAKVRVAVKNGKIKEINFIQHKYGKGKKAENIVYEVIDRQSLNVDAISGATGSSRVILKAIENALVD